MKRPLPSDAVPVDRIVLDPKRIENAKRRARTHLLAARSAERTARTERAKVKVLANTWGFDVDEIK